MPGEEGVAQCLRMGKALRFLLCALKPEVMRPSQTKRCAVGCDVSRMPRGSVDGRTLSDSVTYVTGCANTPYCMDASRSTYLPGGRAHCTARMCNVA